MSQIAFHIKEGLPIGISFGAGFRGRPRSWQFRLFRPTPTHLMAVSVRRVNNPDLEIRFRRTVPLVY
ncbi:MAG TPA: hypothetical protein VJX23_09565, partial [Candidatus Binataceae bacterium]|nr:hypothetical protein [Candidatus Binataceae bacterium]